MIWSIICLPFRLLRWTLKLLWWYLISTLPIWILPFIIGVLNGFFLWQYDAHQTETLPWRAVYEYLTVNNAMRNASATRAPYHIAQLRESIEWYDTVGLTKFDPRVGLLNPPASETLGLAQLNEMNVFYRKTTPLDSGKPWHHWVYVSAQPMRSESLFLDAWDQGFNELLKYHYANPPAHDAKFNYVSCTGSTFCEMFRLTGPSLLHFTTESDRSNGLRFPLPGHDPVTVRLVELPITNPRALPLTPGIFPSTFNQLRSFTDSEHAWRLAHPYSRPTQTFRRLDDITEEKAQLYPRTYGQLIRLDNTIRKFFGQGDDSMSRFIARHAGIGSSVYGHRIATAVWMLISSWFPSASDERRKQSVLGSSGNDTGYESLRENFGFENETNNEAEAAGAAMVFAHSMMKDVMEQFVESLPEEMQEALMDLGDSDWSFFETYLGDAKRAQENKKLEKEAEAEGEPE